MGRARYGVLVGPDGAGALAEALLAPATRAAIAEIERHEGPWREPQDPRWHRHSQLQHLDFQGRLVDMVVQKLDRMSMSQSLEARVPFLDHEVVELAVRIPAELVRPDGTEKWLLREALAPVLPEEIVRRKKRGLTAPAAAWLRASLPPFAEELLSPERVADAGYFDPKAVRAAMDAHRAGHPSRAGILLIALAVQVWDDIFVRGNRPPLPPPPRWEPDDAQRSGIPLPSQSAAS
jgi:asparagine synthetase B (glutamine-hydrolysing)